MPTRLDVKAQVNNAETMYLVVRTVTGALVDVTSHGLRFVVKRYSSDPDVEAVVDEDDAGSAIRKTDPVQGEIEVDFTLDVDWRYWWRLDVIVGGKPSTAMYGHLTVEAT